jgi:hypothetical protein
MCNEVTTIEVPELQRMHLENVCFAGIHFLTLVKCYRKKEHRVTSSIL